MLYSRGIQTFSSRDSFVCSQYFYGFQIIMKKIETIQIQYYTQIMGDNNLVLEIKLEIVG